MSDNNAPSSNISPTTSAVVAAIVSSLATATITSSPRTTVKQEVITAAAYFDASVVSVVPALDGGK